VKEYKLFLLLQFVSVYFIAGCILGINADNWYDEMEVVIIGKRRKND